MHLANVSKQRPGAEFKTPSLTRTYEAAIKEIAADADLVKHTGQVALCIDFYQQKRCGDVSNLLKAVEDALNGLAYIDDGQVDVLLITRSSARPSGCRIRTYDLHE